MYKDWLCILKVIKKLLYILKCYISATLDISDKYLFSSTPTLKVHLEMKPYFVHQNSLVRLPAHSGLALHECWAL